MSSLGLYFHTLRYLRPVQFAARLRRALPGPAPDLRPPPPIRAQLAPFVTPISPEPSLVAPDTFRMLNRERKCDAPADWRAADMTLLWLYHLHYFDDLNARDHASRRIWHLGLLERWIEQNPPGRGPGWEPYPVSRRIINWVKWTLGGEALPEPCRGSLAVQARWLERRLEFHLQGNHLLANASALVHAGLYFQGEEAERWFLRGMQLAERQLAEQVLPDGGHFERSPMYHAVVTADMMDLVNLLGAFGRPMPPAWNALIAHMRGWLTVMTHPDGEIAFFNDAALGMAPSRRQIEEYANRLNLPAAAPAHLPLAVLGPSGYLRTSIGAAYLICDCGPVGPDCQPGHAHADTLSFEMSLAGQRLIVNSGTSEYGTGPERKRQRGTLAHSTVSVDGSDSSEVWAGFRVARRAQATHRVRHQGPERVVIEAEHDGFRRLPGRNLHMRRWTLVPEELRVEDHLSGSFGMAQANFFLHPDVRITKVSGSEVVLAVPHGGAVRIESEGAASVAVESSTWHPRFGESVPNHCVVVRFVDSTLVTHLRWSA